jgi:hypothetical protein
LEEQGGWKISGCKVSDLVGVVTWRILDLNDFRDHYEHLAKWKLKEPAAQVVAEAYDYPQDEPLGFLFCLFFIDYIHFCTCVRWYGSMAALLFGFRYFSTP